MRLWRRVMSFSSSAEGFITVKRRQSTELEEWPDQWDHIEYVLVRAGGALPSPHEPSSVHPPICLFWSCPWLRFNSQAQAR